MIYLNKLNHYLVVLSLLSGLSFNSFAGNKIPLSLVIDDLGYSLNYGKSALELTGEHTYAIIPDTTYAKRLAELANKNNKEVIMHLPMQSTLNVASSEKSTLNESMTENSLIEKTEKLLLQMPYISGLNNHMGSQLTQLEYIMRPVMETIYKHNPNLYFLDSRTSPKSTAFIAAKRAGLKALKRNVFLDHDSAETSIRYQFNLWIERAKQHKSAIAIGHPTKTTLKVITPLLKEHASRFNFIPLSQYKVPKPQNENKLWPTYLSQWHKAAKTSKPLQ